MYVSPPLDFTRYWLLKNDSGILMKFEIVQSVSILYNIG